MNEQWNEGNLARVPVPAPDPAARQRAKLAALEEFARQQAANGELKATEDATRPSRDGKRPGNFFTSLFVRRALFGGIASACVVAFATAMLWPMFARRADLAIPRETDALTMSESPFIPEPITPLPPDVAAPVDIPPPEMASAPMSALASEDGYASAAPAAPPAQVVTVQGWRGSLSNSIEMKNAKIQAYPASNFRQYLGDAPPPTGFQAEGDDKFEHFEVNPVKRVADEPVSTFSVDVDTASYSFVRRQLTAGVLPQKDAVRVEEMINYFDYAWPKPDSRKVPFEPTVVVSDSPWGKGKKLVHIAIKGYEMSREQVPDVNLVLLLDVSGSMDAPDKLPLAIQSMELLLSSLKPTDTVGIVVYAGAAGTVLEPTLVQDKQKILSALRELTPGGSTAGAEGIERAYQLAESHFRKGGVNRIILATDGDFNVGIDDAQELKGFVERKREKGIYLSVLGFGQGNYRDELAQALAQSGNGVAAYIDTLSEAQKVLVQESSGSLFTIAKDVKLQVEFNPATVSEYRLVGYETRALNREDFNNDAVDAGDVGAGHTVTAIYELTPVGSGASLIDPSRYAQNETAADSRVSRNEYGFLKIRYKLPDEQTSRLLERPIPLSTGAQSAAIEREVRFSTAVAGFAQLLKGGTYTGALSYDDVIAQAQATKGEDAFGYRTEFVQLVRKAKIAKGM